MTKWISFRTFCAIFLSLVGLGLILRPADDARTFVGSLIAAIGLTVLLQVREDVRR